MFTYQTPTRHALLAHEKRHLWWWWIVSNLCKRCASASLKADCDKLAKVVGRTELTTLATIDVPWWNLIFPSPWFGTKFQGWSTLVSDIDYANSHATQYGISWGPVAYVPSKKVRSVQPFWHSNNWWWTDMHRAIAHTVRVTIARGETICTAVRLGYIEAAAT